MPSDPADAGADTDAPTIRDAVAAGRFELDVAGRIVFAEYERAPGLLVIRYVYAPPILRGTGAAGRLMQAIAVVARGEDRRIRAVCGYARAWLRRRDAHRDLLVD